MFRNRERHGQLARYKSIRPPQEKSSKIKHRIIGKSDEKPVVDELQDYNSASAYHVSVYIY